MWLARAAGRPCFNLDPYLMDAAALGRRFDSSLGDAQIAIVEGNKGLYDGLALDHAGELVYLAPSRVNLELTMERWPAVHFRETREHLASAA